MFASFKLRDEEWEQDGRFFNGYGGLGQKFLCLASCVSCLCYIHGHNPMTTTQNHDSCSLTCGSHLAHQRCPTCGSRLREPNPCCPVLKCDTKQPHENDPNVKLLMQKFAAPDRCLGWVKESLSELRDSMIDDYHRNRVLGWYSRVRQVEELYFRTLYILFLAPEKNIPHILAGAMPNSLATIYEKVNTEILFGKGELMTKKSSVSFGLFRPIDILNEGAHIAFTAMQRIKEMREQSAQPPNIDVYLTHVRDYICRVDHMREYFEAGKSKQEVRQLILDLHAPREVALRRIKETR